ncbi:MAG: Hpt domain-containing protein [Candidatus Sulfotelmatobacter sp.]
MIDQFKQAFLEEAREILVELESALLELNENRSDRELVGRAFRALHTMKGSGAMFGFDELAAFTHNLETAFDAVRNGELLVTSELINLSLAALDQIKAMLHEAVGGAAPNRTVSAEILKQVQQLIGKPESSAPAPLQAAQASRAPAPPEGSPAPRHNWRIRFSPGPDMMRNGANPLLLLRELKQLGSLQVTASMAAVPPIAELEPERCYISWEVILATAASREAISDVFIFVADSCELTIEPLLETQAQTTIDAKHETETNGGTSIESAGAPAGKLPVSIASAPEPPKPKYPPWGRRATDTPDIASSIRVPATKLDQFVNLVGELVTVQARLGEIATRHEDPEIAAVSEEIERLTSALRENSINIRMLPLRATFERFRRLVHDLARDLHKEVELTIEGAETELDKSVTAQ